MSGRNDNFGSAVRERDRRIAMQLDNPGDMSLAQAGYLGPSWDAFYGSLHDKAAEAASQGKNFSVDLSGIGSLGGHGGQSGDDVTARTNAVNAYLGELTDQNRLKEERFKQTQAQTALAESAARQASQQEQDQASLDRALQTGGQPARTIQQNPDGSYATGAAPAPASVEEQRANVLKMLPGHLQPVYQQQWAKQDADRMKAQADLDTAAAKKTAAESSAATDDVSQAVTAMKEGTVPPQLPGRASKDYTKILAEAKRQGYDLATAATDWTATQKHIQTMNGAQQLRLNQAVNSLPEMLDTVDSLATKWKGGKFPILNKANLALAKNGAFGSDAASIANQLEAQIADVTADLGNVYMGGNSPTERALELAGKSLNGEWDEKVLKDAIALAKKNVQIRQNSIRNTGVAGASAGNTYGSQRPETPAAPAASNSFAAPREGARRPIPGGGGLAEFRGGKWIRVQ